MYIEVILIVQEIKIIMSGSVIFQYIETFFFISLGITFVLILLLVYHFKQRMLSIEEKTETMFDLINSAVGELQSVKNILRTNQGVISSLLAASAAAALASSPSSSDTPPIDDDTGEENNENTQPPPPSPPAAPTSTSTNPIIHELIEVSDDEEEDENNLHCPPPHASSSESSDTDHTEGILRVFMHQQHQDQTSAAAANMFGYQQQQHQSHHHQSHQSSTAMFGLSALSRFGIMTDDMSCVMEHLMMGGLGGGLGNDLCDEQHIMLGGDNNNNSFDIGYVEELDDEAVTAPLVVEDEYLDLEVEAVESEVNAETTDVEETVASVVATSDAQAVPQQTEDDDDDKDDDNDDDNDEEPQVDDDGIEATNKEQMVIDMMDASTASDDISSSSSALSSDTGIKKKPEYSKYTTSELRDLVTKLNLPNVNPAKLKKIQLVQFLKEKDV